MRFPIVVVTMSAIAIVAQATSDSSNPASSVAPPAQSSRATRTAEASSKSASIAPNAPVITIHGLCENSATQSRSGAGSVRHQKATICKTIITRAQFEALANALQPSMGPADKRQLAVLYSKLLLMQREFRNLDLGKDPGVKEALDFANLRSQAEAVEKKLDGQAQVISDADVEQYYKSNSSFYETADLLRIYVPKQKRQSVSGGTPEPDEESMRKEADALQAQAVAGEDFTKLQNDAYAAAGIAGTRPPVKMGKLTANELPPNQRVVISFKLGEVSPVIVDNGYYIFKVLSKDAKPLAQVQSQIRSIIAQQRLMKAINQLEESGHTDFNEDYFPAVAAGSTSPAPLSFGGRGFGRPGFQSQTFGSRYNPRKMRFASPPMTQQSAPAAPNH